MADDTEEISSFELELEGPIEPVFTFGSEPEWQASGRLVVCTTDPDITFVGFGTGYRIANLTRRRKQVKISTANAVGELIGERIFHLKSNEQRQTSIQGAWECVSETDNDWTEGTPAPSNFRIESRPYRGGVLWEAINPISDLVAFIAKVDTPGRPGQVSGLAKFGRTNIYFGDPSERVSLLKSFMEPR